MSVIDDAHIVYVVWVEVAQGFIIDFRGEFERTVHQFELVVAAEYEMDRPLRFDVLVQRYGGGSVDRSRVAQFFIERCLIIETGSQTEGKVFVGFRDETYGHARAEQPLPVPVPVMKTVMKV